jgi:hypothetical protein
VETIEIRLRTAVNKVNTILTVTFNKIIKIKLGIQVQLTEITIMVNHNIRILVLLALQIMDGNHPQWHKWKPRRRREINNHLIEPSRIIEIDQILTALVEVEVIAVHNQIRK